MVPEEICWRVQVLPCMNVLMYVCTYVCMYDVCMLLYVCYCMYCMYRMHA